ncbi:MAG: sporulation transcription factor Spo0A [Pararoseburia sp.]|nr:sporulation transcription factor Spo0A [Lachnospiraceae bacterium]MDY4793658.1 sporulation transcription factor Spo0A [Pararoseburia sp.]
MKNKITIGIAEDNDIVAETLGGIVRSEDEFELIDITYSGQEAISLIREKNPDVMLLDVVMPAGGGLDVLSSFQGDTTIKTKFIMVSAIGDEKITRDAFAMGAKYYIMKPFDADSVIRRIKNIMKEPEKDGTKEKSQELDKIITNSLVTLGVPAQLNGYKYLRVAIRLVVEDPTVVSAVTKKIYPVIADMYKASAPSVERAIRHAVEVSWNRGNVQEMDRLFGYTINHEKGKPTNSEYIAMIADHIRMDM